MEINSDQVAQNDILGRQKFSKEISEGILNYLVKNNESLVVGIHGNWGSGKSTLLRFIKTEIEQKKGIRVFEFNPWIFSGKEELHSLFLNEFSLKVAPAKSRIRRSIKWISNKLSGINEVSKLAGAAKQTVDNLTDISITDLKKEVNEILIKQNLKSLIIIDDLDRLAPSEIIEMFQLIKLNANFSNTIFLISFDKSIVADSIKREFGFDCEKYLEKIIQVDYSIPDILSEDIESIFYQRLNEFMSSNNISFDTNQINVSWLIKGLRHFFKNIRDLNRYFNAITFRLPSFHKNVNILDFLIIEAIRLFDFNTYELIRVSFKDVKKFGGSSRFAKELKSVKEGRSKELYIYLFEEQRAGDFRISDPEFFDRYFTLTISKKDVREEDFENFVKHPKTRFGILTDSIVNNKVEFLLRRLSTKSSIPKDIDKEELISVLISIWDNHDTQFALLWRSVWDSIKAVISLFEDETDGYLYLIKEVAVSGGDFNPARFVFTWLMLRNLGQNDDIDTDLLSIHDLIESKKETIESNYANFLRNNAGRFFFSSAYNDLYSRIFITSYAKYIPDDYKTKLEHILSDNQTIFLILNIFIFKDSKTRKAVAIDSRHIPLLLPNDYLTKFNVRLKNINLKTLPKNDAETVKLYLKYVEDNTPAPPIVTRKPPVIGKRLVHGHIPKSANKLIGFYDVNCRNCQKRYIVNGKKRHTGSICPFCGIGNKIPVG